MIFGHLITTFLAAFGQSILGKNNPAVAHYIFSQSTADWSLLIPLGLVQVSITVAIQLLNATVISLKRGAFTNWSDPEYG